MKGNKNVFKMQVTSLVKRSFGPSVLGHLLARKYYSFKKAPPQSS
jgi:hypothetical protein